MGVLHASQTALIVCVVASGAFLGITNTLMTQVVMETATVARPVASSAYSFVRFCGGAIAPFVAGKLAEHVSVQAPFYLGAGMTAIAVGVLWLYRRALVPVTSKPAVAVAETEVAPGPAPLVVAVGGAMAREVCAMAVPLARARGAQTHVLHVVESDVVAGEDAIGLEADADAVELLESCVGVLRGAGVPVAGEVLHSFGTHADVADQILRRADELHAGAIVIGPETRHGVLAPGVTARVAEHAPVHVVVLHPRAGALGRPLEAAALP
jgi:nucleotide-binding universal stress UspA family protein